VSLSPKRKKPQSINSKACVVAGARLERRSPRADKGLLN